MREEEFRAVTLCQMLGSTTRYRILKLLCERPMTPSELKSELGKSGTVISVQLAKLKNAGLVRFKRERNGLFYWPKPAGLAGVVRGIEKFASKPRGA